MIDSENDPAAVYNYFVGYGAAGHIAYGNGAAGFTYGFAPHVLTSIEEASWVRAGQHPEFAIAYAFPIDYKADMEALITAGADGLIPDLDILIPPAKATLEHIRELASIVAARTDVYLATASDDPFHPQVEAYSLQVQTQNKSGAGTDSNLTFTLTGCNGTSSVTIDSNYQNHMESGDVNYVTLPSKDLGALQSITLSSDGSRGGLLENEAWEPGRVEISSVGWGVQYGDHDGADFSGTTVDAGSPQTRTLGSWGHHCDPAIHARGVSFATTEGSVFSGQVASFNDPDPSASRSEYVATIDWGDGTSSNGVVTGPDRGEFFASGAHVYTEEGHYVTNIKITDTDVNVLHQSPNPLNVNVTSLDRDAALSGTALTLNTRVGLSFTGAAAEFADANPGTTASDFAATINWGDSTASSPGVISTGANGTFVVSASHTYEKMGSFGVTIQIVDIGGSKVTARSVARVTHSPKICKW